MLKLRRRKAVVNLRTGKTLVGDLVLTWPWQYRLVGVDLLEREANPVRIDGTVVVPRGLVEFVQIVD